MKAIIGDIGNTVTKICLIKNFKIEKIIYFNSNKILFNFFLKKKFKKIIKTKNFKKLKFFSSVVPKYQFILKKFLKKNYNIRLVEIKERKINKINNLTIKINLAWELLLFF